MALLPENIRLVVEPKKLKDYLLNENHKVGGAKAAFFLGRGFDRKKPESLGNALEAHARTRPIVNDSSSEHGHKLTIECLMDFPDGKQRCVRSIWISETTETFRFITSYPKKGGASSPR